MKTWVLFMQLFICSFVFSQTDSLMYNKEKELEVFLNELRSAKTDSSREMANEKFKIELKKLLANKDAFTYTFSLLKTVGFVDSPDRQLRIVNWNVEQEDGTQKYCCYILHKDPKKQSVILSELMDNSSNPKDVQNEILDASQWYGALYYKIIPMVKAQKKMYTLLGWDGNNSMSTMKIIDVLYFNGTQPKLGNTIFKDANTTLKRVVFEHSKKAVMSLKYEDQYKRIIYDHLSPETPELKGFYSFYVPDFSYDAYYIEGAKWVLKEDVIGVNSDQQEKIEVLISNEKTGKLEKKTIKNKWENPSDDKTPGGGNIHVSVTPDSPTLEEPQKDKKEKKNVQKKNQDPGNLNQTLGTNKKRKGRNNR